MLGGRVLGRVSEGVGREGVGGRMVRTLGGSVFRKSW